MMLDYSFRGNGHPYPVTTRRLCRRRRSTRQRPSYIMAHNSVDAMASFPKSPTKGKIEPYTKLSLLTRITTLSFLKTRSLAADKDCGGATFGWSTFRRLCDHFPTSRGYPGLESPCLPQNTVQKLIANMTAKWSLARAAQCASRDGVVREDGFVTVGFEFHVKWTLLKWSRSLLAPLVPTSRTSQYRGRT